MIIEAIYQSGILKPLVPLSQLEENQKVQLIIEPIRPDSQAVAGLDLIEDQRKHRIQLPPDVACEIADSAYEELWELPDGVT